MNDKEYKEWERQIEEAKTHNKKLINEFKKYLER